MTLADETTRAWIYRILLAAGAVAITYGALTTEQVEAWRVLAEAVLVLAAPALATRNTTTRRACTDCQQDAEHGENPELIDNLEDR